MGCSEREAMEGCQSANIFCWPVTKLFRSCKRARYKLKRWRRSTLCNTSLARRRRKTRFGRSQAGSYDARQSTGSRQYTVDAKNKMAQKVQREKHLGDCRIRPKAKQRRGR